MQQAQLQQRQTTVEELPLLLLLLMRPLQQSQAAAVSGMKRKLVPLPQRLRGQYHHSSLSVLQQQLSLN